MSYETLMYASIGAGIVLLTISIIFFVYYKIPDVVSDLTGRTAKREIEAMKAAGRVTGKIHSRNVFGKKDKSTEELSKINGRGWLIRRKRKKAAFLVEEDTSIQSRKQDTLPEIVSKSEPIFQKSMTDGTVPLQNASLGTVPLPNIASGTVPLTKAGAPVTTQAETEFLKMSEARTLGEYTGFIITQRILIIHTEEQI